MTPIAVAVAAGLALGKPVGILLQCVFADRSRMTSLPDGVTWGTGKTGTLAGSVVSATLGSLVLASALRL